MSSAVNPAGAMRSDRQLEPEVRSGNLQQLEEVGVSVSHREDDEDLIDLREYWNILVRRRATVAMVLAVSLVVAVLVTFLATPVFRAETLIQIDREEGKVLEYQDLTTQESFNSKDFYQTQYELLRSRSLAGRVIDQLGLRSAGAGASDASDTDALSFFSEVAGTITDWIKGDSSQAEEVVEPDVKTLFLANLGVHPVKKSRLVRVSYDSPDPKEAAAVVNAIAENFINMNLERRHEASAYAKTFLEEQTEQVQANLEDSERRLVAYAREREIINLDDKLEILMQKLKEMSSELIQAESARISAEAKYQEMLKEGPASTTAASLGNRVVESFKARKADLDIEYQELIKIYKPSYPRMRQLQKQIAEIDRKIADELAAIAKSVETDFKAQIRREAKIRLRISEIKEEILALQDRSTDYQTLKREVDTNRGLYDGLLQRMKEVGVAAGVGTNNISVVDSAEIPRGPYKPNLKKNLAIALALGLFGGILLAFLSESMDDTMKSSEQVEKHAGVPVLGIVPFVSAANQDSEVQSVSLLAHQAPQSVLGEAFRSLRTSLIFATAEGAPRVLHFTSSSPSEGKTMVAVNTAVTFAQTGNKVLLIDADLRDPSLHQVFFLPNTEGLTNYLASDVEPARIAQATNISRLFVVTAGPVSPNPVELLSSGKMLELVSLAQEKFDYVLIDGPPVLELADALVLASLARASLFVVEADKTRAGVLAASIKRLSGANARIVGCVLSKVRYASGYGYGYGYYDPYRYGYRAVDEQATSLPERSVS
ncbi:GumC family protein [Candidatus Thiosymbion oneisti]|uniref:GumC family protein n=1 Tax=Candidatus Thiosymbion oneisti TaxID=589554 RepID=UPI00105F3A97|nr:polysaccharide biosynthesis tyrosine autokinase [Candidatus Thiosymbion oneisti]